MLTFLRKIRNSLIESLSASEGAAKQSGGSTRKYILYAIGEIALVVIGILIALQINNWNENRKNEELVKTILIEIRNDLLGDIEEAQLNVDNYLESISQSDIVLDMENPMSYDDFRTGRIDRCLIYFYSDFDFVIDKNGFENLKQSIDKLLTEFRPLLNDFRTLYIDMNENIRVGNERIRKIVYENVDFLYSKDWGLHRRKF